MPAGIERVMERLSHPESLASLAREEQHPPRHCRAAVSLSSKNTETCCEGQRICFRAKQRKGTEGEKTKTNLQ